METISDREAIAEVNRGNREMFEVLVRRYNQRLYRLGMAYLRDHRRTEEAMQNCYVRAFLALGRFGGRAAFSTWLTRIMINECLGLLRQRRAELPADFAPPEPAASDSSGARQLTLKEMKALLESALQELPRKLRAVYLLREIERLSTAETAASLRISASDVKVSLLRAREALKRRLLRRAETGELFAYNAPYCNALTAAVMARILAVSL